MAGNPVSPNAEGDVDDLDLVYPTPAVIFALPRHTRLAFQALIFPSHVNMRCAACNAEP